MVRALLLFILISPISFGQSIRPGDEALRIEKWLYSLRQVRPDGLVWPVAPPDTTVTLDLYSGTPGIILFYLELYRATNKAAFLAEARTGADYLMATADRKKIGFDQVGFYTGEAGIAYTLNQVFEVTHFRKYREGANRSVQRLAAAAKIVGDVADWRYNDIVYGGAGIGLMLLELDGKQGVPLAIQTGNGILAHSLPGTVGKKWYMDTAMVRQKYYMPNFSHGTAGVGYFLARLYKETGRKEFLEGAMAAAQELVSLENSDAWVPHHDDEEGKNLFYLSWCHGPAGTARLYYELFRITGGQAWMDRIRKAAEAMMTCGIPEKRLPGYWNNVSVCCGNAGIASFYLDLYRLSGDKKYLDFSYTMTKDLMARATPDGEAIKWTQAEHRRRPEFLQAQTGLMQGASGVGLWLLKLDAFEKKAKRVMRLPDDPF
jgi:lantibiotic modifying enzyme